MSMLKKIIILIVTFVLAYFSAGYLGQFYERLFPGPTSIFLGDFSFFIGFPLAYVFFLSLLFTAFGGAKKYWWLGILLIPAAAFEVYFDLEHIYFPIILGLAGWVLGYLVSKFLP